MGTSEHLPVMMNQIQAIDGIINTLGQGSPEFEKIRGFLRKHHDVYISHRDST